MRLLTLFVFGLGAMALVGCSSDDGFPVPDTETVVTVAESPSPTSPSTTPVGTPVASTGDSELDDVVSELDRLEAELAELDILEDLVGASLEGTLDG